MTSTSGTCRGRRLITTGALCLLASIAASGTASAQARDSAHVFGGFSALRELGSGDTPAVTYSRGWLAGGGAPMPWWNLTIVGEAGTNTRENLVGETQRLTSFLGGVRRTLVRASAMSVFAQGVAGLERFSEPGFSESGLAIQPGAGVDVAIAGRAGARAQVDYRIARQNSATYREVRVFIGAVVRLGG